VRSALANGVIVALIVAGSVVMAGVASTLALERPDLEGLDASLESRISADYSQDERIEFAPLDEDVIDVAQGDGTQGASDNVEIVAPFRLQPPGDTGDQPSPSPTPTPTVTASSTPRPSATAGSSPPVSGTFTLTPTPTPTPTPGPNVTPAPTVPAVRTPTPTPTPVPTPKDLRLYLHNNPTPPIGDTTSHAILTMGPSAPSATTLHNYDTDHDSDPGIVIKRGNSGLNETDPAQYQTWRSSAFSSDVTLLDSVTVTLWTAMKDFDPTKQGSILVYLRDANGSTYTTMGVATVTRDGAATTWQQLSVSFSKAGYKIAAGHQLELKITVSSTLSEDDVWFAYDTTAYPARIEMLAIHS
jgi:hypothetical protein